MATTSWPSNRTTRDMTALYRSTWKANLNGSELSVVKEDRNPEALFSIAHTKDGITERATFRLGNEQAMELARFLANISLATEPWKTNLNGSELTVTKEDDPDEVVVFSIGHTEDGITEKTAFHLSHTQTVGLARFLANILTLAVDG